MSYDDFIKEWYSESETISCHTSGSTGTPSHINLPKREMISSARRTCSFFEITSDSHLHSCISPDYIGGKMMFVRSVVSGATFSYEVPSNRPLDRFTGQTLDLVSVVPSQMLHIFDRPDIIRSVRNFLIGGSAIPDEIKEQIINLRISAYESYGMTETSSHIALRRIKNETEWFETLPGISVFYHSGSQLGIKIDGWKEFFTNDVAEIKSPTSFKIIGRADNAINTGGKKVFPEVIERKLSRHLNIPFFISSHPDEKWGERVVLATSDTATSTEAIMKICKSILPSHESPKEIIRLSAIPMTPNGKIKRIKFPLSGSSLLHMENFSE